MSKDLAAQAPNALSAEMMAELQKDQGQGLENVRAEDLAVPFLVVLQKNSPQVDDTSGVAIAGMRPGQFLETGTQTAYDKVQLIPCAQKTCAVEWYPRESGGGFVAQHEMSVTDQLQKNERGQWVTAGGATIMVQTMYFFCLLITPTGDTLPVVLSFTSSQLKKARTWLTRLINKKVSDGKGGKFQPPMYEMVWELTTIPEKNEKGSWYGVKIDALKNADLDLIKAARAAKKMFDNNRGPIVQPNTPPEEA